jgi:chemotaxis protein methyltransferase CheR
VETGEQVAPLPDAEFALARRLIAQYAGIKLSPHKRFMVYNRLVRRLRALGMDDFGRYLAMVQDDVGGEREAFVNALTTNLTGFFREPHHFELLGALAREHRTNEKRPLRVWSSACSTGEEPWSIAMTLREAKCPGQVLASDIDTDALDNAARGIYSQERAATLPAERLRAHCLRGTGANEGFVAMQPDVRAMVEFMPMNLQAANWPDIGLFDAVFCRNVVIYFDRDAQKAILQRFTRVLRPRGILCVGHAESFPASNPAFVSCGRTAYRYMPG